MSYLSDCEPYDGGYVSFGQGGCKITGKGTIKTGKLEFENVYFVKDLKYNLFRSVEDKILVPKPLKNCARCAKCGHPVNGPYCQGCALLRERLEEDLVSYLKYFHDASESSDDSTSGSESHPPMLNKENYVPWSSRLLPYAKSRPNGKLIHNSILNGPYVRRMIAEPGDGERDVNVNETFHEQTDDELSERELKQIEADDQAIQTILLGLPEEIYAAVFSRFWGPLFVKSLMNK
uniref:Ribonuclease H-like domain-containing protein n=1 Tax=Tanacetum cinerariifolium TaxID=118510 RepID=A0A6L2KL33_TANCI|nr:ribonuclease H-like domain-containing protein [Tanacetum cinerariifolium]